MGAIRHRLLPLLGLVGLFALGGCATSVPYRIVATSAAATEEIVGTYLLFDSGEVGCLLMLAVDGSATLDLESDAPTVDASEHPLPAPHFDGTWVLTSPTLIEVVWRLANGTTQHVHLDVVQSDVGFGLRQRESQVFTVRVPALHGRPLFLKGVSEGNQAL